MTDRAATTAYWQAQCRAYPALQAGDALKALHQSVCGCGHLVRSDGGGLAFLQAELSALPVGSRADVEPLPGDFCRVHLGLLQSTPLRPETLFRLFFLSAEQPRGSAEELEAGIAELHRLRAEGILPFAEAEFTAAADSWRAAGYPACRHSEAYRAAYAPAYRVIRKDYARLIPLLTAIDARLAEKGRLLVAIEGGAGSGKSTLGDLLTKIYDCNLFHADDYFLQPHQRTAERLAEPGGNLDRERLEQEILKPLRDGEAAVWRRYDCGTQSLRDAETTLIKALNIVEGAYSMHPDLAPYYDLSLFLRIDPAVQAARILRRNGEAMAQRFFDLWLPLEARYFEATDAAARCDLILEVDT